MEVSSVFAGFLGGSFCSVLSHHPRSRLADRAPHFHVEAYCNFFDEKWEAGAPQARLRSTLSADEIWKLSSSGVLILRFVLGFFQLKKT